MSDAKKLEIAIKWLKDIEGVKSSTSLLASVALAEIQAIDDQFPLGDSIPSPAEERIGIEVLTDQLTEEVQRHAKTIVEMGRYKTALERIIDLIDREAFRTAQNVAIEALSPNGEQKEDGE